jgi:hypothetical protein
MLPIRLSHNEICNATARCGADVVLRAAVAGVQYCVRLGCRLIRRQCRRGRDAVVPNEPRAPRSRLLTLRPTRLPCELQDAESTAGHLLQAVSVFGFAAEHTWELFSDAIAVWPWQARQAQPSSASGTSWPTPPRRRRGRWMSRWRRHPTTLRCRPPRHRERHRRDRLPRQAGLHRYRRSRSTSQSRGLVSSVT